MATVAVTTTSDNVNGDVSSIAALIADSGDDGVSLREAILAANATAGKDVIEFNIPGTGVQTIVPSMPLPTIIEAVEINGYSQLEASPNTLANGIDANLTIELDGSNAGAGAIGLHIVAEASATVSGLVINGFDDAAITISEGGGHIIEGNFLGTDPSGTLAVGNRIGVKIIDSPLNTIGDNSPAERNLISGNQLDGVLIVNAGSFGNLVQGNFIGTDRAGLDSLGNASNGVLVTGLTGQDTYAFSNLIGGSQEGEGNLISGNGLSGVSIFRGTFNRVEGNLIGTTMAGNAPLPNAQAGVVVSEGADNVIGGTVLGAGNVISGNGDGVRIFAGATGGDIFPNPRDATRNLVQGNLIGTDISGFLPIPNLLFGVLLNAGAGSTVNVVDNTIGGTDTFARNIISGNGVGGVVMITPFVVENKVQGNFIGTDITGLLPLGNLGSGVTLSERVGVAGAPSGNIIGGTEPRAGNVISANLVDGVRMAFGASGNFVQGNFIGTTADGLQDLGNMVAGVSIEGGVANIIGGFDEDDGEQDGAVLARNVISGNEVAGVFLGTDADLNAASNNVVLGNYIGTNAQGTDAVPNGEGVLIQDVPGNFIGVAPLAGPIIITADIPDGGNLISGNLGNGVAIQGASASGNRVVSNYIGTNPIASEDISNGLSGVLLLDAPSNFVGSTIPGGGNIIAGNAFGAGVTISGETAQGNNVLNNWIGYARDDTDGPIVIPNLAGVSIENAPANIIGGVGLNMRNVISGNDVIGIIIDGNLSTANQIVGNYVGTNELGTAAVPNGIGVAIFNAGNNLVGDGQAGAGNLISGNQQAGILIEGADAEENKVQGNFIGVDADGATALPNNAGVAIIGDAFGNVIGSDGDGVTDAEERNVISGNLGVGVQIVGSDEDDTSFNEIEGNYIGTDKDGAQAVPNHHGVVLANASENFVNRNVISGNQQLGVGIEGEFADSNFITANIIGTAANGVDPLGNGNHGIFIEGGSDNRIGRDDPEDDEENGNTIAFNGSGLGRLGHGVVVASGVRNRIRFNSIHSNAGRGIDLGNDVLLDSINDAGDGDDGANNLQNQPVVTRVEFSGGMKTITWELDGVMPNVEYNFDFFSNTELDPSGFGEGEKYLRSVVAETESDSGFLTVTQSFPATELFISATVTDPFGNTSEFSMVDTDGDALADAWELLGIDVNEDGVLDLPPLFLQGASTQHKDIFVEIDAMTGVAPSQAALDMVIHGRPLKVEGFANVPNNLVNNPDGMDGISLHLELGETDIPRQQWSNLVDGWPVEFDEIKNGGAEFGYPDGRFGTPEERADPNGANIREARRLIYHYALFADDVPSNPRSGQGEIFGNDFYVTLGDWSVEGGTDQDNASTLMHELGHNLGLEHGGGDSVNYKPNYYSIMNYIWDDEPTLAENQVGFADAWRLDYSRSMLPSLDESALSEMAGFGGDPTILVPIGPVFDIVPKKYELVAMGGAIDLNGNSVLFDVVARDVNFFEDENDDGVISNLDASPGDELVGHNDWSNLRFAFTGQPEFVEGVHASTDSEGFTLEIFEHINSVGIGPGVLEFSHEAYDELESSGVATIRVVRGGGTDGAVTVTYSVAAGTATAGIDFTMVSGVLEFADGEFRKTFTIPLMDDDAFEANETIQITLTEPTGGAVLGARHTAQLSILNDDLPTLIGDYNLDGAVDAADYVVWRKTLGQAALSPYSGADGNGDGDITANDYGVWRAKFGETLLPPASQAGQTLNSNTLASRIRAFDYWPDDKVALSTTFASTTSNMMFGGRSTLSPQSVDLLLSTVANEAIDSDWQVNGDAVFNERNEASHEDDVPLVLDLVLSGWAQADGYTLTPLRA